jgi:hypothetical protein
MFSDRTFEAHDAWILSCFNLGVNVWLIVWLVFPTFWLFLPVFSTTLYMQLKLPHPSIANILWCVCIHPISPMGIHLLCCAHGNECIRTHDSWHLCHHWAKCWLPCGTRIITCVSFNHIQLLSSTNWHYANQKWHSHFNQHCHCWHNVSRFTSLILYNSRIYSLWWNLGQGKNLS